MERFKNRWVFALLASLSAFVTVLLYYFIYYLMAKLASTPLLKFSESGLWSLCWIAGISAFLAAFCRWPAKSPRDRHGMTLVSTQTVFMSFVFTGWLIKIAQGFNSVFDTIFYGFVFGIFGSMMSLGIPYLIGFFVSQFFVDASLPKTKYFSNRIIG